MMAWLESHQSLGDHPKTRKAAHILGIGLPAVVGHLQFLWWWAMDYAPEGDLSRFDDLDIAIAARWEGDAVTFVGALVTVGFLETNRRIHDWSDYAGKWIERRAANAQRMRDARASHEADTKEERAAHVQRTIRARAKRQEQHKQQDHVNAEANASDAAASDESVPFSLLEAMCEASGTDIAVIQGRERSKQLAVAKRLLASGLTVDDVGRMTRWWLSGRQGSEGVDMFVIERHLTKWETAGKPDKGSNNGAAFGTKPVPWNSPKRREAVIG